MVIALTSTLSPRKLELRACGGLAADFGDHRNRAHRIKGWIEPNWVYGCLPIRALDTGEARPKILHRLIDTGGC